LLLGKVVLVREIGKLAKNSLYEEILFYDSSQSIFVLVAPTWSIGHP
jgi:hypothetical protein